MNFKEVRKLIGDKVSAKKIREAMNKISPAEFRKEMGNKDGSMISLIKKKIKAASE